MDLNIWKVKLKIIQFVKSNIMGQKIKFSYSNERPDLLDEIEKT